MELVATKAFELAARFTAIPGFPNRNEAIGALADDLRELCIGRNLDGEYWDAERQAVWLTREARLRMPSWSGSSNLRQIYLEKFDPDRLASCPVSGHLGNPQCPKCKGDGYIIEEKKPNSNGPAVSGAFRCSCFHDASQRLSGKLRSARHNTRAATLFD